MRLNVAKIPKSTTHFSDLITRTCRGHFHARRLAVVTKRCVFLAVVAADEAARYVCNRLGHEPFCPSWTPSPYTSSRMNRPVSSHSNECWHLARRRRTRPGRHLSGCNVMHGPGRSRPGTGYSGAAATSRHAGSVRANTLSRLVLVRGHSRAHPLHHAGGTAGRLPAL